MSDYFGILKEYSIDELSQEELRGLMLEKKLIFESNSMSLELIGTKICFKDDKITLNFNVVQKLTDAICDCIKQVFKNVLDEAYLRFYQDFNEDIFGLDFESQRTIALKDFKSFFNDVKVLKGEMFNESISSTGIKQVKTINKFVFLEGRQNAIKGIVSSLEKEFIYEYLKGNSKYFEKENLGSYQDIQDLIHFESTLRILVSLNDQFKIEDDFQFSNKGVLRKKYNNYTHIFSSFEVYEYTFTKIQNLKALIPSEIESLYEALRQRNLILGSKNKFIDYLQKEHNIIQTKLRKFEKGINPNHDSRVAFFLNELEKYSTKK